MSDYLLQLDTIIDSLDDVYNRLAEEGYPYQLIEAAFVEYGKILSDINGTDGL